MFFPLLNFWKAQINFWIFAYTFGFQENSCKFLLCGRWKVGGGVIGFSLDKVRLWYLYILDFLTQKMFWCLRYILKEEMQFDFWTFICWLNFHQNITSSPGSKCTLWVAVDLLNIEEFFQKTVFPRILIFLLIIPPISWCFIAASHILSLIKVMMKWISWNHPKFILISLSDSKCQVSIIAKGYQNWQFDQYSSK